MQEPEQLAGRRLRASVHLRSSPAWRMQDLIHATGRARQGGIAAAAVDQDQLSTLGAQWREIAKQGTDGLGLV